MNSKPPAADPVPASINQNIEAIGEYYKREEQRRFEILDAHWDLPIKDVDLDAK